MDGFPLLKRAIGPGGSALYDRLHSSFPATQPQLEEFPSGAFMIDLKIGGTAYVIEYLPSMSLLGLSLRDTAVFGWEGVDESFSTPTDLEKRIE